MQTEFGRARSVLALGALLTMAGSAVSLAQSAPPTEHSLLGVTLLKSSYRDVMKKFGRPDEIQAGGPFVPSEGNPAGAQPSSGPRGGGGMMGGMAGGYPGMMGGQGMSGGPGGGGGKKATSKNGFPGKTGTGASGPSGSAGSPGGYPGMMGGQSAGGGLPGFGGAGGYPGMMGAGGTSGGSPGYPGMMGGSPGYPGMAGGDSGAAAGMGGSGGADANADQAEYEATWWYHDRKNGLHKSFLFNKDGRVIQVQEYGHDQHHKGGKTRMGVGLGSGLNQILHLYGWSNDGANDGKNVIMRFGGEEKVAFQLVNNVVVGITVAVVKDTTPAEAPQ